MIRVTAFLHHAPERAADVEAAARAAGAEHAAPTAPVAHRAGQTMAFAVFDDDVAADGFMDGLTSLADHVEVVRYAQGPARVLEPGISGIQRTLLLHVVDDADPSEVARFERQLADMGSYIDAIRNSSLSRVDRVVGGTGPLWTHVWEQEFRTLDGLTGPYMQHAHHWGLVDTWFDPQAPNHIVDTTIVHAMCALERSFLARA